MWVFEKVNNHTKMLSKIRAMSTRRFARPPAPNPPFVLPSNRVLGAVAATAVVGAVVSTPVLPTMKLGFRRALEWEEQRQSPESPDPWDYFCGTVALVIGFQAGNMVWERFEMRTVRRLPVETFAVLMSGLLGTMFGAVAIREGSYIVWRVGRIAQFTVQGFLVDLGVRRMKELKWRD